MADYMNWLAGENSYQPANANIATTGFIGSTPGYSTEENYQRGLQQYQYYSQHPEELAKLPPAAQQALMKPPVPPESQPYQGQLNLTRGYTQPLLQQMGDAAAGRGPSQAQNMLREGTATTVATQYGGAMSPSVGGAAQAALVAEAGRNAAGAQQQGARQAAQLRAQEMTDARGQLANTIASTSGQYMTQAGQNLEREKTNSGFAQGSNALAQKTGEENRGGLTNMWGQAMRSDIRAKEDIQPMDTGATASGPSTLGQFSSTMGHVMNAPRDLMNPNSYIYQSSEPAPAPEADSGDGGGSFITKLFSDERSKEKIRSLEGALAESRRTADTIGGTQVQYPSLGGGPPTARFADLTTPAGSREALAPVHPYEYRYKPQFAAETGNDAAPRAGIMAQEFEQSPNPAIRSAVIDTPMGKAIDGKRALSANLALSAGLDKRLRNIEQGMSAQVRYPNLTR